MVASIAGFGIGSLLTPVLAVRVPTKAAVVLVTIPHFTGTLLRFWQLRRHTDWRIVRTFGLTSAAGGLIGAALHGWAQSRALTGVFAGLLLFAGTAGVTGLAQHVRFRGPGAWIAGGLSGLFGGLVGNQGGVRSAALLGFDVRRDVFVGTATAIALLVDAARLPVYLVAGHRAMSDHAVELVIMSAGTLAGTVMGKPVLSRVPAHIFRRVVGALILSLGVWMAAVALRAG